MELQYMGYNLQEVVIRNIIWTVASHQRRFVNWKIVKSSVGSSGIILNMLVFFQSLFNSFRLLYSNETFALINIRADNEIFTNVFVALYNTSTCNIFIHRYTITQNLLSNIFLFIPQFYMNDLNLLSWLEISRLSAFFSETS